MSAASADTLGVSRVGWAGPPLVVSSAHNPHAGHSGHQFRDEFHCPGSRAWIIKVKSAGSADSKSPMNRATVGRSPQQLAKCVGYNLPAAGCLQVEPPTMQRIVCTVQSDQEIHFWLTGSVRWSTFRGVSNRAGLCLRHPERPRNPALFLSRSTRTGATLVKKSIDKHGRKRIATGSTFRGGCLQLKVFIQHDGKRLVTSCGY